jgi:hypothetical protein
MEEATEGRPVGPYSLGEPAANVYDRLAGLRQSVVDTGRVMAELTIPSLVPPDGWRTGDKLAGNNQSVGSHCVNNLAAALLFIAFPPNQPVIRLEAIEYAVQAEIDADPELYARLQVAMSRLAEAHRTRMMSTTMMSAYSVALKLLIVAGNCLWKHTELDSPQVFPPNVYVCKRDAKGNPLLSIHKERISVQALDPDLKAFIYQHNPDLKDMNLWEQEVDIHSVCNLCVEDDAGGASGERYWRYWQEYKGRLLPGTEVETDYDDPPMIPEWWTPVYGQDWGTSHCEEYRGDLFATEALSSSIIDMAAAAAASWFFVNPSGRTSIKQLREARNLSMFSGKAEDVTMFRAEKGGDLQVAMSVADKAERRLGMAFLLNFAIQRSGERVTAEEIRRLGNELDKALGGRYSELAQRTQRPIMLRFMHLHEEEAPQLPRLPKDLVQVQVITGVDALGNSKDAMDLEELATAITTYFPQEAGEILKGIRWAARWCAAKGIKPDGLISSQQEVDAASQAKAQAAQRMALIEKGTGPAVAGAASMADGMMQQQQQQMQPQQGA